MFRQFFYEHGDDELVLGGVMSNLEEMGKSQQSKKPHTCPVCGGRGSMPVNFYDRADATFNTGPVQCKTCLGRGVIWG